MLRGLGNFMDFLMSDEVVQVNLMTALITVVKDFYEITRVVASVGLRGNEVLFKGLFISVQ